MSLTDRAHAAAIIDSLRKVGVDVPAVTEAHTNATRLAAAVRNIAPRPSDVYTAVATAVGKGKDPAADAGVQRLVTASALGNEGVIAGVDSLAFAGLREVFVEQADAVVSAWAGPFDRAAGVLAAAHQRTSLPLEDSAGWLRQGTDAADRWARAQAAAGVIDIIGGGWSALGEITGLVPNDLRYRVLRSAAATGGQWEALELERRKLAPWDAVLAGLELSLPSFVQYRDRVAAIQRGAQGVEAAAEEARNAYLTGRRPRTIGVH